MRTPERIIDVEGRLDGERVGMTIDTDALGHIMGVLTDLYSDPEAAVIREYATNALDAHIVAGVARPIEVTLPSSLSPFLRIRDYGEGLDADGIRDIYSRYGTSTKRMTDEVVGMLGLGCKSALTYTDQFTLTGVKGGIMTQVSVGRDEDGRGSMTIVAAAPSDEPGGVEVTIPVKRDNHFAAKAAAFFRWWTAGTVLVDGAEPTPVTGTWLDDAHLLIEHERNTTYKNYVIMGNVPYPVPDEIDFQLTTRTTGVAVFVEIGDVQFTPSREALQMTRRTRDRLEIAAGHVRETLNASLERNIREAGDPLEAQTRAHEAQRLGLPAERCVWKGRMVLLAAYRSLDSPTRLLVAGSGGGYRRRKSGDLSLSVPFAGQVSYGSYTSVGDTLWFEGFDGKALTEVKRAKLDQWVKKQDGFGAIRWRYVFAAELTPAERFWIRADRLVQWADVAAEKLPTAPGSGRKSGPRGSYNVILGDGSRGDVAAKDIDRTKPIVWTMGGKWASGGHSDAREVGLFVGVTTILLPSNRIDKFKRDFPEALPINIYKQKAARAALLACDPETVRVVRMTNDHRLRPDILRNLPPGAIHDPALRSAVELAKRKVGDAMSSQIDKLVEMVSPEDIPSNMGVSSLQTVIDRYPLLSIIPRNLVAVTDDKREHLSLYLNAAYAADRSN